MKIRSITCFLNPGWPLDQETLDQAATFISAARPAFQDAGYEVETTRLATIPFPYLVPSLDPAELVELAEQLENQAQAAGYDYLSLGPAVPQAPESYPLIPKLLAETRNVFLGGIMTTPQGGLSLPAVRACAEIIHQAAPLTPDGFTNLRFAALANVPPESPFFPAAYAGSQTPSFALATESAGLAVEAAAGAGSLGEARRRLIEAVEGHAHKLIELAQPLALQYQVSFGGIDFSLAPFPREALSLGTALEKLGLPAVGLHGSLAAAAFLASSLDRARFQRAGFSGLFMPVLEDSTLAARAGEGQLAIKDLLLFSAVCGAGLDTVPLPGDTTPAELQAILLDLAALALRLDKPLTARLMPIPGKTAGDPTDFDFDYFANSRIMSAQVAALAAPLAGDETIAIQSRAASRQ